jgi:hypothetical protein
MAAHNGVAATTRGTHVHDVARVPAFLSMLDLV